MCYFFIQPYFYRKKKQSRRHLIKDPKAFVTVTCQKTRETQQVLIKHGRHIDFPVFTQAHNALQISSVIRFTSSQPNDTIVCARVFIPYLFIIFKPRNLVSKRF